MLFQLADLRHWDMPLDELPTDHRGVAGGQARRHAQALLESTHVRLNVVVHAETVGLLVLDPALAATAVGIAVDVDGGGGLGDGCHEQTRKDAQTKCLVHDALPLSDSSRNHRRRSHAPC
ncbi:hypothetical protein D9M68_972100 [compost metagenome]